MKKFSFFLKGQICKNFNALNQNWIGYLSNEFNCNECINIENNCNLDFKKEKILINKDLNFKLIIMWLTTFGSIIIILLASKLCLIDEIKFSADLDDFNSNPPTCSND